MEWRVARDELDRTIHHQRVDISVRRMMKRRSFERRYFPGRSALGRRVHISGWPTIVGVVADVRMRELDTAPPMQIYLPLWQVPTGAAAVVVRGALRPDRAAAALRGLAQPGPGSGGSRCADDGTIGFRGGRGTAVPNCVLQRRVFARSAHPSRALLLSDLRLSLAQQGQSI